ncbi:MAG: hypothetical protein ACUVSV_03800 [Armatimonadota bacterium]
MSGCTPLKHVRQEERKKQDRFPALRTISVLFKVMVWIVVVIGVIAAQAVLVAP